MRLPPMLVWLALSSTCVAAQAVNPDLFAPANLTEVRLKGLIVRLGKPVLVTSVRPWQVGWRPPEHYVSGATREAGSYLSSAGAHLVPFMARFPGGNLLATYALDADTQENPVYVNGYQISMDGGAQWGPRYTMIMQHQELIYIPKAPDSLLGIASELSPLQPGDLHNFVGPAYLFQEGGRKLLFDPRGIKVLDWPWPVEITRTPQQPESNWHVGLHITGNAIVLGDRILATAYGYNKDELMPGTRKHVYRNMLLSSEDGGYTWHYYSTIAQFDPARAQDHAYEGPDETTVVQLANGDLMAAFRVGSGRAWHIHRTYSHDQGKTWTKPEALPAFSVWPQLLRTANGTIALATGRPGIGLWFSTDELGRDWQQIDIVEHHNRQVTDPAQRIGSFPVPKNTPYVTEPVKWETSSYNALVQVAPDKLLMLYDRSTERIPKDREDFSHVFVLPIELVKTSD